MSEKRPLKCGIIGCGVIAPTHVKALQALEGVSVAWACDLIEDKARALADAHGIPNVTTDYEAVLADDDVDCIHVCTDHASHAPISVAALKAGKHVVCEKALAATTAGLDAMVEAHAASPDLVFAGIFQHRFDENYRYLKKLIDDGAFGTILTAGVQVRCLRTDEYYRCDAWRGTWAKEGGAVLINQAIHFIDSLLWIMGGAKSLAGCHANLTHEGVMETEDTATASLRFRSGALGTIEATCSSNLNWEPTLSIHGSDGAIDLRNASALKVAFKDEALGRKIEEDLTAAGGRKREHLGKSYYGPSHTSQIADFIDAVREGRKPFVTAQSARHTVDVVLGIYRSCHENAWVDIASTI